VANSSQKITLTIQPYRCGYFVDDKPIS